MTNNELIKELVVYDGYTFNDTIDGIGFFTNGQDEEGFAYWYRHSELEEYLNDMNILHRIAVKVTSAIREKLNFRDDIDWDVVGCNSKIVSAMFTSPNEQGEHLQLATALVNAIRYISANKAG